jgi:hypothetical protein
MQDASGGTLALIDRNFQVRACVRACMCAACPGWRWLAGWLDVLMALAGWR